MIESSKWPDVKLGDYTDILTGYPFKSTCFTENPSDIPLIRGYNVIQGKLRWEGMKYWPASEYQDYKRYQLQTGDVVLAMDRPWVEAGLKYAWIREQDCPCLLVQRVARLRGKEGLLTDYVRYVVGQHSFSEYLRIIVTGVNVPHVSASQIKDYMFSLPPVDVQRKIVSILSAFDDLMENNRRRIHLLEEIARALYREWFVHFRFPGHEMVDSELGLIPKGWEVRKIDDSFQILGGGTPSTRTEDYWQEGEINWYTPSDLTKSNTMFMEESSRKVTELGLKKSSARMFPPYSVMMTSRATLGVVSINTTPACTNQGFITCLPNEQISMYQIFFWIKDNVERIISLGTGSTYREIIKSVFREMEFLVPPKHFKEMFESAISPMGNLILTLQRSNSVLSKTRDLLLPRLMSGSIDVSNLKIKAFSSTHQTSKYENQSTLDQWLDDGDDEDVEQD